MLFSERQKLEKEYYKWLDKNKNVKPCPFSLISFLDGNGNLFDNKESDKINVLKKALELACIDLLKAIYPNHDFVNHKPKITMKNYIYKAEKLKKGEEKCQRNSQ